MKKDFRFKGKRPDDIFEAITVMAKRARQINQKRSEDFPIQNMIDPESDEVFENDTDFDSFEKPASLAMVDYEQNNIEFEYEKQEEPEEDKETETEE
jgi:DNA-directed RNA polymerase subunit K/omega